VKTNVQLASLRMAPRVLRKEILFPRSEAEFHDEFLKSVPFIRGLHLCNYFGFGRRSNASVASICFILWLPGGTVDLCSCVSYILEFILVSKIHIVFHFLNHLL